MNKKTVYAYGLSLAVFILALKTLPQVPSAYVIMGDVVALNVYLWRQRRATALELQDDGKSAENMPRLALGVWILIVIVAILLLLAAPSTPH
jgi:hypothetical protein